ncbi:MAG: methyl-accepting chemotaxis protein [Candidatus Devosia euplotis]|nr:methyl-accepting chemotaxis protein [Candidatus Devosia euplotis]
MFGDSYLQAGGGAPEQTLAVLGGQRFDVRCHPFGANRFVLEFLPAGRHVGDYDLAAFVGALASGRTGFRFDVKAIAANPVPAALNGGLAKLDVGLNRLEDVAGGHGELPDALGALGTVARRFGDFAAAMARQLGDERDVRSRLEARLRQVGPLVEHFEARMAMAKTLAATNLSDTKDAGKALGTSSEHLQLARTIGHNAQNLAGAAEMAAQRTQLAVGDIAAMTGEIDKLVQAIEDVPFRTNLLALNAAVEAERAGKRVPDLPWWSMRCAN